MLQEYIYKGKEKLRCGYTTGSCAAAAAKAASEMLLTGETVNVIELMTPKGILLKLDILKTSFDKNSVSCAVQKDSGDDPDITNGILIFAKAEKIPYGIEIDGGNGVGRVTKKGLDQPVGAAAINSVPRKMINDSVKEICEKYNYNYGIKITIFIPNGEEIAQKTFNSRLGIIGGLSIIGTTGIVEPMSNSALVETIRTEERVLREEKISNLILTIGNYSENFIKEHLPEVNGHCVMCSNYIGEAIDIAVELGFKSVLIVGHIGKLVKLGAGIMNTHSSQADGRMEVLITCGVLADTDINTLKKLTECVTADAALTELDKVGKLRETTDILMKRTQYYLNAKAKGMLKIGAIMFSDKFGIIGKTEQAVEILAEMKNTME